MDLDCWSTVAQNGQNVLQKGISLGTIEQSLVSIQNIPLQGQNPAIF